MKEFRQPDRSIDDSFELEEQDDLDAARAKRSRKPGKRTRAESLEEILELVRDPALPAESRERMAVRYLQSRSGSGQLLDGSLARDYGRRLGMDLAGVRVHTDPETAAIARALGATALTFGKDIFFASGVYQPTSPRGRQVIAHEVAHVAQHRGQAPSPGSRLDVGREGDRHEREADAVASKLLRGKSTRVSRASAGVRFMRQAFGELDEPIVAEGAGGLGCSPEELEEIQRLVDSGKAVELLDNASSQREKNIIRFCIGRSDIAQDEATKAFMREHDNPKPEQHFEIQGVGEAQRAAAEAADSSTQEPSDLGQQPDEIPNVQTASARSAEAGSPGTPEAAHTGTESVGGGISGGDESIIRRALTDHEVYLTTRGLDEGLAAYVTAPANFEDFGLEHAAELLKRMGTFSSVGQTVTGAQALYSLINRDWEQTWEQLSSFGEGSTEYERLANNVSTVVDSIDLMLSTIRGVADALGSANSGLWLSNVMTTVDTGEIAAALSRIAQGVTSAAGVLGMIRNSVLVPAETVFRELDRYQKQADPSAPEQAADVLLQGADGLLALVGGMASTPGGGGPDNASGSSRAGDAEENATATPSPADLPLQDVSPQGYESMAGEAADVEEDAAGIAVRDRNRDPEQAAPGGRQLAETEAADDMTGRGKPEAKPERAQVEGESQETERQMESSSPVGDTQQDEHDSGGHGEPTAHATSSGGEAPTEIDSGGLETVTSSSRPVDAETDTPARARLEHYQEMGQPELEELPSDPAQGADSGRENPPTTLAFLDRLQRTIAFLIETKNRATSSKAADLGPESKSLQDRGRQLQKDVASRQDAHRAQQQRMGAAEAAVRQFKSESSRGQSALETLGRVADVGQMVGQLPGRLGATIAGLSQRITRATKTWSFVSAQMGGQEQEVAALKARQVTEARRLDAVGERANQAGDKLAQADEALKAAGGAEQDGASAETGAVERQLERYQSTYDRLSGELVAWAQRNQSSA